MISTSPTARQNASKWPMLAARLFFAAAVVLIPIRSGITLAGAAGSLGPKRLRRFCPVGGRRCRSMMLGVWAASFAMSPRRLTSAHASPGSRWRLSRLQAGPRHYSVMIPTLCVSWDTFHRLVLVLRLHRKQDPFCRLGPDPGRHTAQPTISHCLGAIYRSALGPATVRDRRKHLDPTQSGVSIVAASGGSRLLRAYGLTDHPNILGGCLAFGLLLLLALDLQGVLVSCDLCHYPARRCCSSHHLLTIRLVLLLAAARQC